MPDNRAAQLVQYGGPESVLLNDVPVPQVGAGQVLIRVACAGVNTIDKKLRIGALRAVFPLDLPVTLGAELAGTIEAVGASVSQFAVGDRVMAWTENIGSYARFVAVDASLITIIPDGIDDQSASALPIAALTASQALFEHGLFAAGQTVLINGASGSVGTFATQLAAKAGATVIGTAPKNALDYIRDLGVTQAIDFDDFNAIAALREVDLALDFAGQGLSEIWPTLRESGTLVSTVVFDAATRAPRGIVATGMQTHADAAALAGLAKRVADGDLRVHIAKVYAFEDASNAVERLTAGAPGKAILVVDPS